MDSSSRSIATTIVIVMAIAFAALLVVCIVKSTKAAPEEVLDQSEIADYGMEDTSEETGEEIVTSSGDSYVTTDDTTEEMDSIPNEEDAPAAPEGN